MQHTLSRTRYVVAVNQPGYLPESPVTIASDRPSALAAFEDAVHLTLDLYPDAVLPIEAQSVMPMAGYALAKGEPFTLAIGGYLHSVYLEV